MSIQQTLRKIKYLFLYSGMKLHETRAPDTRPIRYRAAFIFHLIWFFSACLTSTSYFFLGMFNGINFKELSFVAPCITYSFLAIATAANYTYYDTDAYQLIEDLLKLDLSRNDSDNSKAKEIKATETNFILNVLNVLNAMYILLIILYNVGPLVCTAVVYYRTSELKLFLPFLDVYPFDALDLKYWPYAYIHQSWSVFLVVFYVGSVECFLLTCCSYIRIQFRLIQLDISNIIPVRNINSGQVCNDNIQFQNKFKEIVSRHQTVIRLSNSLRKINSKSILANVISSSLIICLTGFNVTAIEELTLVMPSIAFLNTSLLQGLCLCYFGDLLMTSSAEVCDAVYASRWYLADTQIKKQLIFILTRAQIPCKLTASAFMDMNLRAYMKIIKTSWSYFALLKTIYDR